MRKLSPSFMKDLLSGLLNPILDRVKHDQTLMLAIRDGYINIYYRGGNILKIEISVKMPGCYNTRFDKNYAKYGHAIPPLPSLITNPADAKKWVDAIPRLKEAMDF